MKIVKIDRKTNYLEIVPASFDDLWHISKIIEKGDIVRGNSERKIKPKDEGGKPFRQKMFVEIEVEKAELSKHSSSLRILGVLIGGEPEELIDLKAHHSLDISLNTVLKLEKNHLYDWQIDKLEKAAKSNYKGVHSIILDDETLDYYLIKDFSHERLLRIKLAKKGKRFKEEDIKQFSDIKKTLEEKKPDFIVIAGPGFEKESLQKFLNEQSFPAKIILISLASSGITGLNELLKSEVFAKAAGKIQIVEETLKIESFFEALAKDKPHAYGFADVKKAVELGAVEELVLSEELFNDKREEVDELMQLVEKTNGKIHIISSESEAKKKLEGIGGIVALLRYKLE